MHRFFVTPECIRGESVTLSGDIARQLARVLRCRPGDRIVVLDGSGWEHLVTLDSVRPDGVEGYVSERWESRGEPCIRIALYQGVLKLDKFDLVLQKGTELGVSSFTPVFCARSIPQDKGRGWGASRYARWRRVIREAAEQSHRGTTPALDEPLDFLRACDDAGGLRIIPWEDGSTGLRQVLERWKSGSVDVSASSVSLFIGPEGGFTPGEIKHAEGRGITPVSLGRRVLRSETASIAAIAAILYELGELGG